MKKILFITFLFTGVLLAGAQGHAQSQAQEILKQLATKINEMGDYNAEFEVQAEGNRISGAYVVSGDKYYMKTNDYEVISDGRARYEINKSDKEVLIDKSDPNDRNILSNPTRAFEFADDLFRNSYKGEESTGNQLRDVVVLNPVDAKSPLQRITLKINRKTGLPVELRYLSEGLSDDVVVNIKKIEKGLTPKAVFSFDRAKYKDYDIVDFR